ncbi:MAG: helix-turn-helix domain-containing protein [Candidatus Magasanikbacteria bacterium]|nr:helix-turn-helix domain-containing protein [Candidatus Magasanikbacteria bacterium]
MKTWKTTKLKSLAKAFLSFKAEKDLLNFFRDLMTLEELEELSGRWEVVLLLHKGIPYRDISKKTGLSTATITRIAQWLNHGEGGYRTALDQIKKRLK